MVSLEVTPAMTGAGLEARPPDKTSNPWSRLWSTGVLHSCASGIQGNYDGPILEFWHRQLDTLEDGARVLDIGTGNGALLLLAHERARQRGITLKLHGIDIADIDPARTVPGGAHRFEGIAFHPRTSASAIPFEDAAIDLACSQFGFEYAPRERSISELVRVARPRSRIALIVHSSDSIVARVSAAQKEGYAFIKDDCRVIDRALDMIPVLSWAASSRNATTPTPGAESKRISFNAAAGALMDAIERNPEARVLKNTALSIRAALEHAGNAPDQAEAILCRLRENLSDEEARLTDLQAAQLTRSDLDALAEILEKHYYTVRCVALEQRAGVKIGWAVEAIRG